MQLLQPFNAAQFDPTQGGTGGFPVGKHKVVNVASEVKPTKGGDSGQVVYEAKIIEGEFTGLIGAIRFQLYHTSQQTVEIAHKQYSAMCHCIGVLNVTDTAQLHNIPYIIDVVPQKGEDAAKKGYTEVKKFYDANGNEPGQHGAQNQQQQQNNSGFGNQGQQQNNQGGGFGNQGQQQNNQGGGFGNQQQPQNNGGFGVANGVPMDQAQGQQQQTGFGPQGQQQQQQQQQPQSNGGGAGQNWTQNAGVQQNNNGGGAVSAPAAGGWGQQRS